MQEKMYVCQILFNSRNANDELNYQQN